MNPSDLNRLLLWCLRFAYPLTLLVLWRRWWPGNWFGAYLAAASLWVWVYDPNNFWLTAIPTIVTGLLKLMASLEIVWEFLAVEEPAFGHHQKAILYASGALGAVLVLGLHNPTDPWSIYSLAWACLNCGIAQMMVLTLLSARLDRFRAVPQHWWHALLWLAYVLRDVAGVLVNVRIADADGWLLTANVIHVAALGCLALWCLLAARFEPRNSRFKAVNP